MDLCLVCLQKSRGECINLFNKTKESEELLRKIFVCSQINFRHQESYAEIICDICLDELNITFNFLRKCLVSEQKFKEFATTKTNTRTKSGPENQIILQSEEFCLSGDEQLENVSLKENLGTETFTQNKYDICNKSDYSIQKYQTKIAHRIIKCKGLIITGYGSTRHYHCSKCDYSSPHSQTLINHLRKHNGEKPYHCACGKSFTQSSGLIAHSKTHSHVTNYTCSVCGKQFKHASTLKRHKAVHEDGAFSCETCKKKLKSKESLQAHMYRHNNIRNYNCEECGDTFVTSSELINHRKKHILGKRIQCNLCGYTTHTKKILILHLKRHSGDKSYRCESCEMSCYTLGELRTHSRVHTRDKPYTCPSCSQRFMHSSSVNKHMKNVHGLTYRWADSKQRNLRKIQPVLKEEIKD